MTSMPASRSARATTLAPRSCPSRPGLATTTRIRELISGNPFRRAGARRGTDLNERYGVRQLSSHTRPDDNGGSERHPPLTPSLADVRNADHGGCVRQRLSSEPDRYRGRRRVPTPPRARYAAVV